VNGPRAAPLGILAGGGALPRLVAQAARDAGRPVHVVGFAGFCEARTLDGFPHDVVPLAKVGRVFAALRAAGCREVVLAGPVRRPGFGDMIPDLAGLAAVAKLLPVWGGDASLLARVLALIEAEGFTALGAHDVAPGLLAARGVWGRHAPDAAANTDIAAGFAAARALGARQRGQAVLVRDGRVVAEETRAGTRALIAHPDARGTVLVKAVMPGQDRRVDLPTIGAETVAAAVVAGLRGIAVEAGAALVIERDAAVAAADAAGLFLVGGDAP
jgi:DUF1009 family protein